MFSQFLHKLLSPWKTLLLISAFAFLLLILLKTILPEKGVSLSDLTPLSLAGYHRLLIMAPHCDDETLGSAGIIMAAEKAGIEVRVVIATNGDGYLFATMQDFRKLYPHAQDFIHMGEVRQKESLAALQVLGVQPEQVLFLSYPDRGSPSEWNDYWSNKNPYRSPYNQETHSPYALTYNPQSVFSGEDFLNDITSILKSYQPDLIIYPHPEDVHPDHWGLNVFTRLAITISEHSNPDFSPTQYTYLVHRPDFPVVKGLKPQENLVPPQALYQINSIWYDLGLKPDDVTIKEKAVQQYITQLPLLRGLMESFVRQNELFAPVVNVTLATTVQGDRLDPTTWRNAQNQMIPAIQLDPKGDYFVRDALPSSDLLALFAARSENMLWLCAQTNDDISKQLTYHLRLRALSSSGIHQYQALAGEKQSGWQTAEPNGSFFCTQASLTELGNPWAIYVGSDTEGLEKVMLDQTAWQMVIVDPAQTTIP